jgi:hypothetical protein
MMLRVLTSLSLVLGLCLLSPAAAGQARPVKTAPVTDACGSCHADFTSVLPKGHAKVTQVGLAACVSCHHVGQSGAASKNAYSTRLHVAHVARQKQGCTDCHTYATKKSFGLIGLGHTWGAPGDEDLALMKGALCSWAGSKFMDHLHAKGGVDCAGCHGKTAPVSDSTVENDRCLACHGPVEKLATRSANAEFPKRNPHDSHLGNEIACTVCHHAHAASVVYCADCHRLWKLTIPGSGN